MRTHAAPASGEPSAATSTQLPRPVSAAIPTQLSAPRQSASDRQSRSSSPCVAAGRVYYGTTAGSFRVLDAKTGEVVRTLKVGSPVISAPTFANGSVYFQAMDAVLRCLDLDGKQRWSGTTTPTTRSRRR